MCEALVIPFLFGSFFTVCHPYIRTYIYEMFYYYMQVKCSSDPNETSGFVRVNKILTLIPLLFIFLRIWSLVQYIYTVSIAKHYPDGCVPQGLKAGYLTLGIMQVKLTLLIGEEIYVHETNVCIITGYNYTQAYRPQPDISVSPWLRHTKWARKDWESYAASHTQHGDCNFDTE